MRETEQQKHFFSNHFSFDFVCFLSHRLHWTTTTAQRTNDTGNQFRFIILKQKNKNEICRENRMASLNIKKKQIKLNNKIKQILYGECYAVIRFSKLHIHLFAG